MEPTQFNRMLQGLPAKALMLDDDVRPRFKKIKNDKSKEGKQKLKLFTRANEEPLPADMPVRVGNLVKKLRRKKWSEVKIANHVKRHFKITVV